MKDTHILKSSPTTLSSHVIIDESVNEDKVHEIDKNKRGHSELTDSQKIAMILNGEDDSSWFDFDIKTEEECTFTKEMSVDTTSHEDEEIQMMVGDEYLNLTINMSDDEMEDQEDDEWMKKILPSSLQNLKIDDDEEKDDDKQGTTK